MSINSYISLKAKKGIKSKIQGEGLCAVKPIKKGEVIAIKNGYIINKHTFNHFPHALQKACHQISDDFFLGPLTKNEVSKTMLFLNHSCQPNIGIQGEITFVAMRDIAPGEELTTDYAMLLNYPKYTFKCNCNHKNCRKIITGKDWMLKKLQRKYKKYFSLFLLKKFTYNHKDTYDKNLL